MSDREGATPRRTRSESDSERVDATRTPRGQLATARRGDGSPVRASARRLRREQRQDERSPISWRHFSDTGAVARPGVETALADT